MTLAEAEKLAMSVLREVVEEKVDATNVEVASITVQTKRFRLYTREEVGAIITSLPPKEGEDR
jgi:20S proteasome subunit alpha 5